MARKRRTEDQGGSARVADADEGDAKQESIRRRAQEIYERRKAIGLPGDAESDWLQAEAELDSRARPRP